MSAPDPADLTVTVKVDDLNAVLGAVDYVNNRKLIGPVDRMGDQIALAIYADHAKKEGLE